MTMPNLRDIFFDNDFSDNIVPEAKEAEEVFKKAVNRLAADYNIPFSAVNEIMDANLGEHVESQYLGFVQGFNWAVYLLTGIKNCEEVSV
ncbi:MAG: hypothetical protein MRZ61_05475 [Oscillospiraceae bacterium]|nr:hypothetical protein [Oscillospiraceae bacterium]